MIKVLCHGVFDFFHVGHLEHLQEARRLGDRLVVTITGDAFVNKGPGRPLFREGERAAMLRALAIVDEVHIVLDKTAIPAILHHRPHIYAKGQDYNTADGRRRLEAEKRAVESVGGRLVFTKSPRQFSTTQLLERLARCKLR